MKTLADLIGQPSEAGRPSGDLLSRFGMERNPFPTARTILPAVMYNQDVALSAFATRVQPLLGLMPAKRSLAVIGGTGGGKSHFLRHCQFLFETHVKSAKSGYVAVEFLAGANSVAQLIREVLRSADEVCKGRGDYDLLAALARTMEQEDDVLPVKQTDLRNVLQLIFRASKPGFAAPDRDGTMTFDPLRELAKRWLAGATLSQTERKYLGVYSRLATASMMTRVATELLSLAKRFSIIGGVLICLDEVEAAFSGRGSSGRTQTFLQDLRYLFDEAAKNDDGYSLMVISASTTTGATYLRDFNYPLYQRLGFEGDQRVQLEPITSLDEVSSFAIEYIAYEQRRTAERFGQSDVAAAQEFLSADDYQEAFSMAASATREMGLRSSGSVNQGQLLEALHLIVQRKQEADRSA